MKRILTLILALAMVICLCACGKDTKDDGIDRKAIRSGFDKAVAYSESLIDTDEMTASVQDNSDGVYLYKRWGHDDSIVNTEIGMDVEVKNHTITIGTTTVGELKDMGFEIECGYESLKPGESAALAIVSDGKHCNLVTALNDTDTEKNINEMPINDFYGEMSEDNIPFIYRGLTAGSTLKNIIDTLGSPNSAASLATDVSGTIIAMDYFSDATEDGSLKTTSLEISLTYDADTDTAVLSNLQLDYSVIKNAEATEE